MKTHSTPLFFYATLIIVALIIGLSFKNTLGHLNRIDVTGGVQRDFVSDIIVWSATFSTKKMILSEAYKKLDQDRQLINNYLVTNNIPIDDAIFSSITISKKYDYKTDSNGIRYEEFSGYLLSQNLK